MSSLSRATPFLDTAVQGVTSMSAGEMLAHMERLAGTITDDDVQRQRRVNDAAVADMRAYMQRAKDAGLLEEDDDAATAAASGTGRDGEQPARTVTLRSADGSYNPLVDAARDEQAAAAADDVTDPRHPEHEAQPDKTRVNRYSVDARTGEPLLRDVPEDVVGYAADGSAIPLRNADTTFRADLPDVMQDMRYRNELLASAYVAERDVDVYDAAQRYALVTCIGPHALCDVRCERLLVRVWAFVKSRDACHKALRWIQTQTPYGRCFPIRLVPVGAWVAVPFSRDAGMHPCFMPTMRAFLREQKRATVELEQRVLDDRVRTAAAANTISKQHKALREGPARNDQQDDDQDDDDDDDDDGAALAQLDQTTMPTTVPPPAAPRAAAAAAVAAATASGSAPVGAAPSAIGTPTPNYDPELDRPSYYDSRRYMVMSHVRATHGPGGVPLADDAEPVHFIKLWGAARRRKGCDGINAWARDNAEYGRLHNMPHAPVGGWCPVPPEFDERAQTTYSNPVHAQFMEQYEKNQLDTRAYVKQNAPNDDRARGAAAADGAWLDKVTVADADVDSDGEVVDDGSGDGGDGVADRMLAELRQHAALDAATPARDTGALDVGDDDDDDDA